MKNRRLFAILLVGILLLLPACSFLGGKEPGTETQAPDPESDRPGLTLTPEEIRQYQIVYPESTDKETVSAVDALISGIKKKTNVKLTSDTDYLKAGAEIPAGTLEILVGATNRPETPGVRYLDYVITNENGRIAISGGCGEKTAEAVEWFLANCVSNAGFKVPGWKREGATYPDDTMKIGEIPIREFSVPMEKGTADDVLREALGKRYGILSKSDYTISVGVDANTGIGVFRASMEGKTLRLIGSSALEDVDLISESFFDELMKVTDHSMVLAEQYILNLGGQFKTVGESEIGALRKATDDRIAEIENTPNLTIPAGAKVYYVSPNGNDSNNGTSPASAWKTIEKVNSASLESGSYVCFERGGVWRHAALTTQAGVTYTAYGTGEKPIFRGSPEDGANASKWKKASGAANVWYYEGSDAWGDVGTLVFNGGESCAVKIVRRWEGSDVLNFTEGGTFNNGYKDLKTDLSFYHDKDGTGLLYLYSAENPGTRFDSIEFNVYGNLISVNKTYYVTITNLAFEYGGSHGIGANGQTLKNLTVRDCTFRWIGGSVHRKSSAASTTWETRFGNGVEIYGGCENYTVENCCFHQIYDAAMTHQWSGVGDTTYNAVNTRYVNNVVENAVYSVEYFYSDCKESNPSVMDGLLIEGNYFWNSAYGFCEQRPIWDRGFGAHIKGRSSGSGNRARNYVIRNNYFIDCKDRMVQITSNLYNPDGSDSMPTFSGNVFVTALGGKLGQVEQRSDPGTQVDAPFDMEAPAYLGGKSDGTDQFWFLNK